MRATRKHTPMARAGRRLRILCVAADWLSTSVAWLLFDIARFNLLDSGFSTLGSFLLSATVMTGQIAFPTAMLGVYWLTGYYNDPLHRSRITELGQTAAAALAATLAVLMLMLLNDLTPDVKTDYLLLATLFGLLTVIVWIPRAIITAVVTRRFRSGRFMMRAAIIGDHANDDRRLPRGIFPACRLDAAKAADYRADDIDCFILTPPSSSSVDSLLPLIGRLMRHDLPVYLSPDTGSTDGFRYGNRRHSAAPAGRKDDRCRAPMLTDLSRTDMDMSTLNIKRLADITVSLAALALLWPVILALAAAIGVTSRGNPFYRQKRIGYHGRLFSIIKLRTMRSGAEDISGPTLSSADDPRITQLGRVLRKYRIDELPQFVNILCGEMSLVGPRPERPYFEQQVIAIAPQYVLLHQLRPGLTSWGMVDYGYASTVSAMAERLRYDLLYLENVGFITDMKIIIHTISTIATGKGI